MQPAPRLTMEQTVAAIRQRIWERLERAFAARDQVVRAACRSEATYYHNRRLYPPPEQIEGK